MTKRYPTYAVIAPTTKQRLEAIARRAHSELLADDELPDTWEVVAGTAQHAAIWDFDPAGDFGYELAPFVSRLVAGTVYLAQRHEHTAGCMAYEGGGATGEVRETPENLAQRLGVPFPERADIPPERQWSVCVVEGARPESVMNVLDLTPEDREVVSVESHPLGAIVFATDESSILGIPSMLVGPGLTTVTTYAVERSRGDLLTVWMYRDGEIRWFFTTDDSFGLGPRTADRSWDIKGAKDVAGVLTALQIPPALLGW